MPYATLSLGCHDGTQTLFDVCRHMWASVADYGGWAALAACGYAAYRAMRFIRADCDMALAGKRINYANIDGKVVWITGASCGIGEGLAKAFAEAGARVVISARRESELQRVKAECRGAHQGSILVLPLDITQQDQFPAAIQRIVDTFGRLDVLVNNAGLSQRSLLEEASDQSERTIMEINYFATVALSKAVVPQMREQNSGQIVVISSVAGKLPAPVSGSYAASKHAVQGFFDTLRIEVAPYGIGVTCVCPGPVVSEGVNNAITANNERVGAKAHVNQGKMPTERCARLVVCATSQHLEECWISPQPILFFTYVSQYCPGLARWLGKKVGYGRVRAYKSGEGNINAQAGLSSLFGSKSKQQ